MGYGVMVLNKYDENDLENVQPRFILFSNFNSLSGNKFTQKLNYISKLNGTHVNFIFNKIIC